MRGQVGTALVLLGLLVLAPPPAARAEEQPLGPGASPAPETAAPALPGVELAETLAAATGIAISPLLGVSAVGAWRYYRAAPEERAGLPWFASRWFWIPGLVIALLLVLKDPVLGIVPGAKKPLDALDVLENKASAVLATPAVVPMFLSAFAGVEAARGLTAQAARLSEAGIASLTATAGDATRVLLYGLAATVFVVAFFCVWLAFHAINVLILLSPFGPLDLLLRSIKLGALAVLVGSTWIHPYLGLAVSLAIVALSIPVAAWSLRLTVFGGVLALDLLTLRHRREEPDAAGLRAFAAGRVGPARARTWGRVEAGPRGISFLYRRWWIAGWRRVELPSGSYRLGRGLVCPVLRRREADGTEVAVLRLPPRYLSHETAIAEALALDGVDDMPLERGLRAVVAWARDLGGSGRELERLGA